MKKQQRGFTLIELIMVIVILGALAATALPKYADLKTEADNAAAEGVYGAAQAATTINFTANLAGITSPAGGPITTATELLNAMESSGGWVAVVSGTGNCVEDTLGSGCLANPADDTKFIIITTAETSTVKAVLGRVGF